MPQVNINDITLHYERYGKGTPLLLLHAGWGLGVNGFSYQTKELADDFQMIVPDRRGYGQSARVDHLDADFHWQAADDMLALLDALKIDQTFVWGHSDGAAIGALMAIAQPDRIRGLIFEGGHLYNRKPLSKASIEEVLHDPTTLPEAAQIRLAEYHGPDSWQQVIRNWAGAWLELYQREGDLYHGRLSEIACPVLIIHGGHDEYTPVGEIEELARRIPTAQLSVNQAAGHSVHDERHTRQICTEQACKFLRSCSRIGKTN